MSRFFFGHAAVWRRGLGPPTFRSLATSQSEFSHVKKVGIIGAGVAGLQMARALRMGGFDCLVFDKAQDVGGLWRENYHGFGIQVPKLLYEFPDFPASYNDFAPGEEVQRHIQKFAESFNLLTSVRLNSEVLNISHRSDGQRGWNFTVKSNGKETIETFDYAVVCTGMYSTTPNMPSYAGSKDFKGVILHSSQYKSPKQVEGKNVVVVGGGKSALDVVCDASDLASSSSILYRNAHWGTPRKIAWLIPFKFVFLSRFGQALVSWYKGAWPTAGNSVKVSHAVLAPVMAPIFRIVEWLFALQLGHKGDYLPKMDVVKDFYGYAQVLDSTFKSKVASGKVKAVQADIVQLNADSVVLDNGKTLPCDVLVCATGFGKSYSYLPQEAITKLDVQKDGLYLYRHCLPPVVQDLAFVGSEVATISNIATHAIQAAWLTAVLKGQVKIPSMQEMQAEVESFKSWKRSWMPETSSRANLVLLHQIHYHDSLLGDMKISHRRKGVNFLAEIFAPYQPKDYGAVIQTAASGG